MKHYALALAALACGTAGLDAAAKSRYQTDTKTYRLGPGITVTKQKSKFLNDKELAKLATDYTKAQTALTKRIQDIAYRLTTDANHRQPQFKQLVNGDMPKTLKMMVWYLMAPQNKDMQYEANQHNALDLFIKGRVEKWKQSYPMFGKANKLAELWENADEMTQARVYAVSTIINHYLIQQEAGFPDVVEAPAMPSISDINTMVRTDLRKAIWRLLGMPRRKMMTSIPSLEETLTERWNTLSSGEQAAVAPLIELILILDAELATQTFYSNAGLKFAARAPITVPLDIAATATVTGLALAAGGLALAGGIIALPFFAMHAGWNAASK